MNVDREALSNRYIALLERVQRGAVATERDIVELAEIAAAAINALPGPNDFVVICRSAEDKDSFMRALEIKQ